MPSLKGLRCKISIRFLKRGRKGKVDDELLEEESSVPFPLLRLSDDLVIHILSFVSSAPFESKPDDEALRMDYISPVIVKNRKPTKFSPFQPPGHYQAAALRGEEEPKLTLDSFGTLTHVLPLVCRKFYSICDQSDGLWKEAMHRLSVASPTVWGLGISQLAALDSSSGQQGTSDSADTKCEQVVAACGGAKCAFQRIVDVYQPFTITAPLFLMGGMDPPILLQKWNLHLYEPRYRFMISQIMQNRSVHDKSGNWISPPGRPRFLISSGLTAPLVVGDPVFVVEILRCKLQKNGRAMVAIKPVQQTRIQSIEVRPNCYALLDATVQTCKRTFSDLRFPVLCVAAMEHIPLLFASLELFIFEDRYRRMMREIMATGDESSIAGRASFILAHTGTVATGDAAMLVEVRKCVVHPDGTANVELVPILKGSLRDTVERPDSGQLYDASIDILP